MFNYKFFYVCLFSWVLSCLFPYLCRWYYCHRKWSIYGPIHHFQVVGTLNNEAFVFFALLFRCWVSFFMRVLSYSLSQNTYMIYSLSQPWWTPSQLTRPLLPKIPFPSMMVLPFSTPLFTRNIVGALQFVTLASWYYICCESCLSIHALYYVNPLASSQIDSSLSQGYYSLHENISYFLDCTHNLF